MIHAYLLNIAVGKKFNKSSLSGCSFFSVCRSVTLSVRNEYKGIFMVSLYGFIAILKRYILI